MLVTIEPRDYELALATAEAQVAQAEAQLAALLDQPSESALAAAEAQIVQAEASLAQLLDLPLSNEVFFLEAHIKMRPMDFMEEGIFICGIAHYPKFIEESISQAQAAAGRATTILSKKPFHFGGTIAVVDPDKCVGCLTCVRICPYGVPQIQNAFTGVGDIVGAAYIEAAVCHGCGTCVSECPARAIQLMHYTDAQTISKLDALFEREPAGFIPVINIERLDQSLEPQGKP